MQCAKAWCNNLAHPAYRGIVVPYCTHHRQRGFAWYWNVLLTAGSAET